MQDLTPEDFFKPGGLLSRVKPGFTQREGQADLSNEVTAAIAGKTHVLAEGPTGFGKSFALLVPAVIAVLQGKRVVVSTETLALQDQYVHQDLPVLLAAVKLAGYSFSFASAKGRSNYVCRQKVTPDDTDKTQVVTHLTRWAMMQNLPQAGDIASVPDDISFNNADWADVAADDNCERRGCPYYGGGAKGDTECFVFQARKQFLEASIVVTNHTMLLLDRQYCSEDEPTGNLLGPIDLLIVDEAHTLPEKAQGCWGEEFGPRTLSNTLRGINRMLRRAGLDGCFADDYLEVWHELETELFAPFNKHAGQALPFEKLPTKDLEAGRAAAEKCLAELKVVRKAIGNAYKNGDDPRGEDAAAVGKERVGKLFKALDTMFPDPTIPDNASTDPNIVRFIETHERQFAKVETDRKFVKLNLKPIEVGMLINTRIFASIDTVVIASATLKVQGSFKFARKELGMPGTGVVEFVGKTPFNFAKAVRGYFPTHLPAAPKDRRAYDYQQQVETYYDALADEITRLVEYTEPGHDAGGALVLFTSAKDMKEMFIRVKMQTELPCLLQGEAPKHSLISRMKEDHSSVLFATKSFFTGVDIPGNALHTLIMLKAPFRNPTDPMYNARCDRVKARGGSDFRDLAMPLMLWDLLQGFGRLIRSVDDIGVFAFLDSNANSKSYGADIKASLPKIGTFNYRS